MLETLNHCFLTAFRPINFRSTVVEAFITLDHDSSMSDQSGTNTSRAISSAHFIAHKDNNDDSMLWFEGITAGWPAQAVTQWNDNKVVAYYSLNEFNLLVEHDAISDVIGKRVWTRIRVLGSRYCDRLKLGWKSNVLEKSRLTVHTLNGILEVLLEHALRD